MGVDIYLESLFKTYDDTNLPPPSAFENPDGFMNSRYDAMRATGGYFRNGYNAGDVMWVMGLSWPDTVWPMLDEGYLPIARARELIEIIEARPLTRERVAAHIFEHMTDGVEPHPMTGPMLQVMRQVVAEATGLEEPPKMEPPNLDEMFGFLNTRRDQLLVILRKSIELDEPLLVS